MAEINTQSRTGVLTTGTNKNRLRLMKGDITALEVEAFVFYARPDLALGSGFGSAIARRGGPSVKKELDQIGGIQPTESVITSGGDLKARYIVHAAGPVFQEENLEGKLCATIRRALQCAEGRGIRQIAFPPMGAGFYGVPLALCSDLMIRTIREYFAAGGTLEEVIICANDEREYGPFAARLAVPNQEPH